MKLQPHIEQALRVFFIAYVLNAIWEWLHYPLYSCDWNRLSCALVAAFGDAGLIILVWAIIVFMFKQFHWTDLLEPAPATIAVALAFVIAWFIELRAAVRGVWAYGPAMPIVPGLGVGLLPLMQLPITTMLTFWILMETQNDK